MCFQFKSVGRSKLASGRKKIRFLHLKRIIKLIDDSFCLQFNNNNNSNIRALRFAVEAKPPFRRKIMGHNRKTGQRASAEMGTVTGGEEGAMNTNP